mmetsp:Transcript_22742/g.28034  ORF Transcript_22742/g.28034 Transcript_22742/m.28034 type:complete len:219 (+) Transcript_22742:351-1007(+)|eukprot:CAMPEP_0172493076 /NCGR_PEP_ID=MMETSP1066-20121228/24417_1 /TAXON_ID=671091 /ORGANISM="Coscinodiscus wailesii, Strain CCMP2513" /LENGTH=218 /DNA_ID=CAMNT_0013263049 /DNA_START=332 /DNA_END=988 /DNA_ORIENTATION=+
MNWFGKKKKQEKATAKDAGTTIVTLRQAVQTQEKREEHLEKKMEMMTNEAKAKMAAKDKKGAMFALKRKKLYEAELEKIQNVKMTLETQVMNLESATQNADTFMAMKQGTNAMKQIRQNVGIEKVDDMMDEIKDEMDMATEISNAIAQPVDPYMHDEDELLKELQELEQGDVEAELLKPTPANLDLPAVPAGKLPSLANTTADEEAELRRLEAEIAGM